MEFSPVFWLWWQPSVTATFQIVISDKVTTHTVISFTVSFQSSQTKSHPTWSSLTVTFHRVISDKLVSHAVISEKVTHSHLWKVTSHTVISGKDTSHTVISSDSHLSHSHLWQGLPWYSNLSYSLLWQGLLWYSNRSYSHLWHTFSDTIISH